MLISLPHSLSLLKHLNLFYRLFMKIDSDSSETVDVDEFHKWIKDPKTNFTNHIYKLLDINAQALTFPEFICVLTTYCMFGEFEVLKFVFSFMDEANKQYGGLCLFSCHILPCQLSSLLRAVLFPQFEEKLLECHNSIDGESVVYTEDIEAIKHFEGIIEAAGVVEMQFSHLRDIYKHYPHLLTPAFRVQQSMENSTFGQKW
jgi:hypothetical protein